MKKVNKVFFLYFKRESALHKVLQIPSFWQKEIIYHQPSIDFTSNTGFLKKKLGLWWNEEEIFLILWKRRRKKRAWEKKNGNFLLFTLRLEKIEQSYSIKNFLSNQLFFRNFLVLYLSTCCKNDDVLENLMVQTVDVRMNVVCKPIRSSITVYIYYIYS